MELTNSKRLIYSASYVTTTLTQAEQEEQKKAQATNTTNKGNAFVKANLIQAMNFNSENFAQLGKKIKLDTTLQHKDNLIKLLSIVDKNINAAKPVSTLELAPKVADISLNTITQLVNLANPDDLERMKFILFSVEQQQKILPIGRIHLERIEMYPVGVQRGELVFSVPMAPGETTTISHKEWTTTSREFEDIVQDFFESYSERGVADKTDASMSNESQTKHSNSFDFGASLSGSYMGVTLTTTLGIKNTSEEQQSVKNSMQKHSEVTEKASARSRKEHKVSMKYETKMGTEDHSGKTITNPNSTAIRIDYYRMMRKWRTDLYRYGLRQTYDLTIPLPGARLWALHQQVAELDKEIRTPFVYGKQPKDISTTNYQQEAIRLDTTVQDPPPESIVDHKYARIDYLDEPSAFISRFGQIDIDVPVGYAIKTAKINGNFAVWAAGGYGFNVIYANPFAAADVASVKGIEANLDFLKDRKGHLAVVYSYKSISNGSIEVTLTYQLLDDARENWQIIAWRQLRSAAEAKYQEVLARTQEERDKLWRLLNGKDTLTLRRLEREELLRLVMQWLLGPNLPITTDLHGDVQNTLIQILGNEQYFQEHLIDPRVPRYRNPTLDRIKEDAWFNAVLFGEQVKFIHQAIEWENILYFLYPYFWGSEIIGREKMLFEHADPEHERFLRAGYIRIVLPVRLGFEEDFTHFIEKGSLSGHESHPYLEISKDIQSFAKTNYAGIPPANPEKNARPLLYPEQRATWDTMQQVMAEVDLFKAKHGHYPTKIDEILTEPNSNFTSTPVDTWGNPFVYRIPGLGADYDLISYGANNKEGGEDSNALNADITSFAGASLVATWFDYTPTSALDIEVDTKLGEIS
ncbi:MAG: type II secretion system protein GspG [Methylobacter sp.]|nr:type II secretion system protein GspG [Methylobacter sp.]